MTCSEAKDVMGAFSFQEDKLRALCFVKRSSIHSRILVFSVQSQRNRLLTLTCTRGLLHGNPALFSQRTILITNSTPETLIQSSESLRLFYCAVRMVSSSPLPTTSPGTSLPDSFASFFTGKISKLRLSLTSHPATSSAVTFRQARSYSRNP